MSTFIQDESPGRSGPFRRQTQAQAKRTTNALPRVSAALPTRICRTGPYLPKISYSSSDVILYGRLLCVQDRSAEGRRIRETTPGKQGGGLEGFGPKGSSCGERSRFGRGKAARPVQPRASQESMPTQSKAPAWMKVGPRS